MPSISLDEAVKKKHEALKPASMSWNDYMLILAQSIDADQFEHLVTESSQREYESPVEQARERYEEALKDPDRLLGSEVAREQVLESAGS